VTARAQDPENDDVITLSQFNRELHKQTVFCCCKNLRKKLLYISLILIINKPNSVCIIKSSDIINRFCILKHSHTHTHTHTVRALLDVVV